jgi:hypothetical protein
MAKSIKIKESGLFIEPLTIDWDKMHFTTAKEWTFNWKEGGWNSVIAKTKKGALRAANKMSRELTCDLTPNPDTFKVPTRREYESLLREFN